MRGGAAQGAWGRGRSANRQSSKPVEHAAVDVAAAVSTVAMHHLLAAPDTHALWLAPGFVNASIDTEKMKGEGSLWAAAARGGRQRPPRAASAVLSQSQGTGEWYKSGRGAQSGREGGSMESRHGDGIIIAMKWGRGGGHVCMVTTCACQSGAEGHAAGACAPLSSGASWGRRAPGGCRGGARWGARSEGLRHTVRDAGALHGGLRAHAQLEQLECISLRNTKAKKAAAQLTS